MASLKNNSNSSKAKLVLFFAIAFIIIIIAAATMSLTPSYDQNILAAAAKVTCYPLQILPYGPITYTASASPTSSGRCAVNSYKYGTSVKVTLTPLSGRVNPTGSEYVMGGTYNFYATATGTNTGTYTIVMTKSTTEYVYMPPAPAIMPVGGIDDTYYNIHSSKGFTDVEVNITPWENSFNSNQAYFYALDLFTTASGNPTFAYAGLQTNGQINGSEVGKMLIFSVFGATKGISVLGGTGEPFGSEGTGYSERIPYNWMGGHKYKLEIFLYGATSGNNVWGALVTDLNTKATQLIGFIYLPTVNGSIYSAATFHELYVNSPAATCATIEPSVVAFTNLTANNGAVRATSWDNVVEQVSGCSNYIWTINASSGYLSAAGVYR